MLPEALKDKITLPVRAEYSAVYAQVVDAEDRLVTFVALSDKDMRVAKYLVSLINGDNQ